MWWLIIDDAHDDSDDESYDDDENDNDDYISDDDDNDLDENNDKAFDPAALPNDHCTVLKSSFEYHGIDNDDDYTKNPKKLWFSFPR